MTGQNCIPDITDSCRNPEKPYFPAVRNTKGDIHSAGT